MFQHIWKQLYILLFIYYGSVLCYTPPPPFCLYYNRRKLNRVLKEFDILDKMRLGFRLVLQPLSLNCGLIIPGPFVLTFNHRFTFSLRLACCWMSHCVGCRRTLVSVAADGCHRNPGLHILPGIPTQWNTLSPTGWIQYLKKGDQGIKVFLLIGFSYLWKINNTIIPLTFCALPPSFWATTAKNQMQQLFSEAWEEALWMVFTLNNTFEYFTFFITSCHLLHNCPPSRGSGLSVCQSALWRGH